MTCPTLVMLVHLPRLLQREKVLTTPIALQRFANRFFAGFDMRVPQLRQLLRIALPTHDGIHDGQSGQPSDVADHLMDLHIHLRQRFLHVLDMLAGHLHQIAVVPHQRPHRAYLSVRSKCRAQQPYRMEKLYPLAFVPVRAPPQHVFHVTGIHQTWLDPVLFQHIVDRNPVHPRALHGDRRDATTHQPPGHRLQVFGERRTHPHRVLVPIRRYRYKDLPRANIHPAGIGLQKRAVIQAHPFASSTPFAFARLRPFLGLWRMLLLFGHIPDLSTQATAKSRKWKYSFKRNQPGVLTQTVTTVWRTELGTTLLIGFNSTTV